MRLDPCLPPGAGSFDNGRTMLRVRRDRSDDVERVEALRSKASGTSVVPAVSLSSAQDRI
jgi:hypothetical protein